MAGKRNAIESNPVSDEANLSTRKNNEEEELGQLLFLLLLLLFRLKFIHHFPLFIQIFSFAIFFV